MEIYVVSLSITATKKLGVIYIFEKNKEKFIRQCELNMWVAKEHSTCFKHIGITYASI